MGVYRSDLPSREPTLRGVVSDQSPAPPSSPSFMNPPWVLQNIHIKVTFRSPPLPSNGLAQQVL